jgi:hypothetical protein
MRAWSAIRELNTSTHNENRADALQFRVGEADWSEKLAGEFVTVYSPRLKLQDIFRRPVPPDAKELTRRSDLVQLDVAYVSGIRNVNVPDAFLASVIRRMKAGLDSAFDLETRYSVLMEICSIEPDEPDEDEGDDEFYRNYDLSGYVVYFSDLFRRFAAYDPAKAAKELQTWPCDNELWERLSTCLPRK